MILHVKYDSNDEPITLRTNATTPDGDIKARIKLLQQYKQQGYTRVKDKFWIQLTGQLATINDYIRETRSYL